jgi:hypothetical protein
MIGRPPIRGFHWQESCGFRAKVPVLQTFTNSGAYRRWDADRASDTRLQGGQIKAWFVPGDLTGVHNNSAAAFCPPG